MNGAKFQNNEKYYYYYYNLCTYDLAKHIKLDLSKYFKNKTLKISLNRTFEKDKF